MSVYQQGMSFYGEMPDMYSLVLNADHHLVKEVLDNMHGSLKDKIDPIENELKGLNARKQAIEQIKNGKKPEEVTAEEKQQLEDCEKSISDQENARRDVLGEYAKQNPVVSQLIDLALLQNGMLKGEALSKFISRSINFIK